MKDEEFRELLRLRAEDPGAVACPGRRTPAEAAARDDGRLMIIAVDHPARRILRRGRPALRHGATAACCSRTRSGPSAGPASTGSWRAPTFSRTCCSWANWTTRSLFGSMNRGGLTGSVWELDDRFTAHDASTIARLGLDGGKMLLRLDYSDPGTIADDGRLRPGRRRSGRARSDRDDRAAASLPRRARPGRGSPMTSTSWSKRLRSPRPLGPRRPTPGSSCRLRRTRRG